MPGTLKAWAKKLWCDKHDKTTRRKRQNFWNSIEDALRNAAVDTAPAKCLLEWVTARDTSEFGFGLETILQMLVTESALGENSSGWRFKIARAVLGLSAKCSP